MYSEERRKEIEKKIEEYSRVNFLSEKQKKKLMKLDYDAFYLEDKVSYCLKNPDIKYLQKVFIPECTERKCSKEISDIEIFKAAAAGDMIGSVYEFTEHDYENVNIENLVSKHSYYTDDTILLHATMEAILQSPKRPNFRKSYLNAYKKFPDVGYGANFIRWANGDGISNRVGYGSYANGSAMRVAVIGNHYKNIEDVIKIAIKSAIVTHNHQDGIKGAVVTAVVIWMAKNGYSKDEIQKYASRFYRFNDEDKEYLINKESYFDLNMDLKTVSNTISKTSIFCDYAVPFAIKCFLETESYQECMIEIVRHYGDTDTICAIAGGICYAYYGEEKDMKEVNVLLETVLH